MVGRYRLRVGDVKRRVGDLTVPQRLGQRVGIDYRPARRVDQGGLRLHALQLGRSDQAVRFRRERAVECHEVGALKEFVQRPDALAAEIVGGLATGQVDDVHP